MIFNSKTVHRFATGIVLNNCLIGISRVFSLSVSAHMAQNKLENRKPPKSHAVSVADPGFPVGGGVDLVGGPWTPEAATFQKFLHVKTPPPKESGPRMQCN